MKKEFELYQDEEGNVYDITTDLEQIIIEDFYKAMKRNNEKQEEIERLNQDNEYLNKLNTELSTLNTSLRSDRDKYKNIIKEAREYINKHCVNEKVSKEVGFKCYTMADTNELEHIMKLLDKGENND